MNIKKIEKYIIDGETLRKMIKDSDASWDLICQRMHERGWGGYGHTKLGRLCNTKRNEFCENELSDLLDSIGLNKSFP